MGTRLRRAIRPTIAPIKLGDEHQPTMIRCVDVASQSADLGRKLIDGTNGNSVYLERPVYRRDQGYSEPT